MTVIPEYWKDPAALHIGAKRERAYFIPCGSAAETDLPRERSSRFTDLRGEYAFRYFDTVQRVDSGLLAADSPTEGWDKMPVPGVWQTNGYDVSPYINVGFTVMYRPPHLPGLDPAGLCVKDFNFTPKQDRRYELTFEGADSCLYVWVNGAFVGYSEVSHCLSIFDITSNLRAGKNRLTVVVLKYCTGTYFEDQDKLRMTGLFRDVYILEREETGIEDLFLRQSLSDDFSTAEARCEFTTNGEVDLSVTLEAPDGSVAAAGAASGKDPVITLTVENPLLWSAEVPALYTLRVRCGNEWIARKIGFRRAEIKDGVFRVNGRRVVLKGVNRHDSHPDKGYAVDEEDIRRDLLMMKEHNVNALRTSHYPNAPRLYEMCDEIGLYVISEADIETHGCERSGDRGMLMQDPDFREIVIDRVRRMTETLKNHPCILIWSLCNETGWGENLAEAARYLKARDPDRPVHCESFYSHRDFHDRAYMDKADGLLDMCSNMYASFEKMEDFLTIREENRPFFQCEYSHAMGNSCGDIRQYVEFFYAHERMMGGCIWEWCDHARRLTAPDGTEYFGYGGDLGDEDHNDGNFCADGLVSPDRQPHTSLLEVKNAYAPVYMRWDGRLSVTNRYDFRTLSHLSFKARIEHNGKAVKEINFTLNTPPHGTELVAVDLPELTGECYLTAEAWDGDNRLYIFQTPLPALPETKSAPRGALAVTETPTDVRIGGDGFCYTLSRLVPRIESIVIDGREMLARPQWFALWRAPLDNDRKVKDDWFQPRKYPKKEGNLRDPFAGLDDFTLRREDGKVTIEYDLFVGCRGKRPIVSGKARVEIFSDGLMMLRQSGSIRETAVWIPRYGYRWDLKEEFSNVRFFGFGPTESYIDKHDATTVGVYACDAEDRFVPYLKPQECGSAFGTKWASLTDGGGRGIVFAGDGFSFNASVYDPKAISEAAHPFELKKSDAVIVHTDCFMSGIGSASCGPALQEQYKIPAGDFSFTVAIAPFAGDEFDVLARFNAEK